MRLLAWCAVAAAQTQRDLAVRITNHYKAQADASRSRLDIQARPTRQDPFVFLHQRKTGGMSLRYQFYRAAKAINATTFIACHGKPCLTFAPDPFATQSVFAAHFYWPSLDMALRQGQQRGPHLGTNAQFRCFTAFREPVQRVTSCWYYRKLDTVRNGTVGKHRPLPDLSAEEFSSLLSNSYSNNNEGCNNEPLRILSDSGKAEEKVNTLTTGTKSLLRDDEGWAIDAAGTLERTLAHTSQCVVGILERCLDTKHSLEHYFPWLKGSLSCALKLNDHAKQWSHGRERPGPTPAQVEVIRRQNALEVLAYDVAQSLLDAQLRAIGRRRLARRRRGPRRRPPPRPPRPVASTPSAPSRIKDESLGLRRIGLPRSEVRKFLVLSQPRSGSTWLVKYSAFVTTPGAVTAGEVLHPSHVKMRAPRALGYVPATDLSPAELYMYLRRSYLDLHRGRGWHAVDGQSRNTSTNVKLVGLKVMHHQLPKATQRHAAVTPGQAGTLGQVTAEPLLTFAQHHHVTIIHLYRENQLARHITLQTIETNGLPYHTQQGAPTSYSVGTHAPVRLDARRAYEFCRAHARQNLALANYLSARVPAAWRVVVPYEALLDPSTSKLIFDELRTRVGLPPTTAVPKPNVRRPCSERVENWAELLAFPDLNRSVWRRMCETGDRLVPSDERYGPLREFWRGYDAPVVEAPPVVEASAPAPRGISPQLFRRYGYFEGEFPLPVRSLG